MRATWAPPGRIPVISHRFAWKRTSMATALVYEPDGSDAQLIFGMYPGAYNDDSLIEFLAATHDLLNGRKVTLIWDGLPSHRSKKMTAWIDTQASWLRVANYCPNMIEELEHKADHGLCRIGSDAQLKVFPGQTPLRL